MIDLEAALRRLAGDRELVRLLINVFLEDAPTLLDQIRASIRAAQWPEAHRAGHSLKGLAANIDAKRVTDAAGEIEQITAEGPIDFVLLQTAVARLEQAVLATIEALKLSPPL